MNPRAMRCKTRRSVTDKNLHVIIKEGEFNTLLARVRHLGPWHGFAAGMRTSFKPHYRLQLAEQGFVFAYQHIANFSPEANNQRLELVLSIPQKTNPFDATLQSVKVVFGNLASPPPVWQRVMRALRIVCVCAASVLRTKAPGPAI
jgi:hypothetical protein